MKLTKKQLKRLIIEELENMQEIGLGPASRSAEEIKGMLVDMSRKSVQLHSSISRAAMSVEPGGAGLDLEEVEEAYAAIGQGLEALRGDTGA